MLISDLNTETLQQFRFTPGFKSGLTHVPLKNIKWLQPPSGLENEIIEWCVCVSRTFTEENRVTSGLLQRAF